MVINISPLTQFVCVGAVAIHYQMQQMTAPTSELVETATERFIQVRQEGGLFKLPGTSEFLDWLKALQTFEKTPYKAEKLAKEKRLPYRELLFKLQAIESVTKPPQFPGDF
ncbi:hypothetical protein [Coleofasciculus sp.]|uniref:hypothetical protein n=1 Tax=Coleofasciculus sp. TaxID=3100458 RepID=UPI003A17D964